MGQKKQSDTLEGSLPNTEPEQIIENFSHLRHDSTTEEISEKVKKEPASDSKSSESPDEVKEKSQIPSRPEKEESPEECIDRKTAITDLAKQSSSQHDEKSSRMEEEEDKITNFQRGILKVTVHAAAELEKKDFIGKSDPYIKVVFQKQEFKSKTINNTQEPNWDFTFSVDINNPKENSINFEVFDEDFGKDSFEGSYSLSLDRAINESTDGDWFYLEGCKSGKIKISTSFEPHSGEENEVESSNLNNGKAFDTDVKREICDENKTDESPEGKSLVKDLETEYEEFLSKGDIKMSSSGRVKLVDKSTKNIPFDLTKDTENNEKNKTQGATEEELLSVSEIDKALEDSNNDVKIVTSKEKDATLLQKSEIKKVSTDNLQNEQPKLNKEQVQSENTDDVDGDSNCPTIQKQVTFEDVQSLDENAESFDESKDTLDNNINDSKSESCLGEEVVQAEEMKQECTVRRDEEKENAESIGSLDGKIQEVSVINSESESSRLVTGEAKNIDLTSKHFESSSTDIKHESTKKDSSNKDVTDSEKNELLISADISNNKKVDITTMNTTEETKKSVSPEDDLKKEIIKTIVDTEKEIKSKVTKESVTEELDMKKDVDGSDKNMMD